MRSYRHIGCESAIFMHIGDGPRYTEPLVTAVWRYADGQTPTYGNVPRAVCPDCFRQVALGPKDVESVDGGLFFADDALKLALAKETMAMRLQMAKQSTTRQTLWARIKALFSFGRGNRG